MPDPKRFNVRVCSLSGANTEHAGVFIRHIDEVMHLFTVAEGEAEHVRSYPYASMLWWEEIELPEDDDTPWHSLPRPLREAS